MTSEIRANTLKNRVGLGTVSYTNTGIVVSGIVTANSFSGPFTGDITGDGDLTLTSTDSGAAAAPTLRLQRDSSSPANQDVLGQIVFGGKDSTPNDELYAMVAGKIIQAGAGGEHGAIQITTRKQSAHVITANLTSTDYELLNGTNLSVDGDITGNGNFQLTSTDTGSSAAPELTLFRNSTSPADADYLGQIKFSGKHDGGSTVNYAKITGKILDASNGTEDGILEFAHIKAGSQTITGRWRSDSLQLLNSTNLTVDGDIDVDGHTNLDNVNIAGITTTTSNIEIKGNSKYLKLGASDQFAFVTVGAQSFITNTTGHLTGRSASYTWENVNGTTEYFRIASDGKVGVNTTGPSQQFTSYASSGYPILANGPSNGIGLGGNGAIVFGTKDLGSYGPGILDGSTLELKISGNPKLNITSTGKVLIGSTTHNTLIASGVGSQLQIEGNSYQTSSLALINNSTSTDPPFLNFGKSRAGSSGGTTIVQNGDRVGGIRWSVADGTDLHSRVAQIDVFVNGTPGSNDTPGQISIQTTPDGSDIPVDRVNIDSAGRVTLGAGIQSQFASQFNAGANQLLITSNGDTGLTIDSTSSSSSSIHFADGPTGNESYRGIIEYNHSEDDMKFAVEGQHIARLRKGSYSDVGGGMIIGNNSSDPGAAHSDSRTLILGHTTHGETGMTLLNSTSGSGKIRFSDGVQYYNQGAIGYYHGTRTVAQIPTYGESLSFVAAQKENNFVLNGNEAIRVCSDMDRQKMVDGFWSKYIDTTYQTVFSIQSGYDNSSIHRGYFYEIIVFGGDWGSHSANRTYFKGFINGANTYQGHTVIEHSGTYGSNTGGQGHYGSSQCQIQVTFTGNGNSHIQMKVSTGNVTAEGYARFIGFIRDYDGFHIR